MSIPLPARSDVPEQAGWYYRQIARRYRWRGPAYQLARTWRHDLLAVLNELEGIVRINAPIAQGLQASAAERRRLALRGPHLLVAALCVIPLFITAAILFGAVFPPALLSGAIIIAVLAAPFLLRSLLLRHQRVEALLLVFAERVEAGNSLSDTMLSLDRVFPPYASDLSRVAEESGTMPEALARVRTRVIVRAGLHDSLTFALLYAFILVFVITSIFTFLLAKVVPVFLEIQNEFSAELPAASRSVVDFGNAVQINATLRQMAQFLGNMLGPLGIDDLMDNPIWVLMLGPILAPLIYLMFRGPASLLRAPAALLESFLAHVPVIRRTVAQATLAPAAEMLALLLRAGVPLPEALRILDRTHLIRKYQKAFARVRERLYQGSSFSEALREQRRLPPSFIEMAALGERANRLPEALAHISDTYTQNTATRYQMLGEMMVPLVVVVIGAVVLWIQMGLYQMVWSLSDAIINTM